MRLSMTPALLAMLLVPAAVEAQSPDWSHAAPVSVELSNFKFAPSAITFDRGATYRIHFANTSSGAHDFVAKAFFAGSTIAPEDRAKIKNGGIDLDGGEAVDVRLVANRPGTYPSHCSHFLHSSFGMTGTIIVR